MVKDEKYIINVDFRTKSLVFFLHAWTSFEPYVDLLFLHAWVSKTFYYFTNKLLEKL